MSQIKLDPFTQLSLIDPIALGLELLKIQAAPAEPFGNHLQRAKTHTGDMPARDVADRASSDRASTDRASEDRALRDRASDDRARQTDSESPSAADVDSRDTRDTADVESRDASADQDRAESAEEKPATEEQSDTDSGEADSGEADGASGEEAKTQGDDESAEVDGAIGAEQIKADLPTETTVETSEESGNESGSAKIKADGADTADPNTKGPTVAEEQMGESPIATSTTSKNTESGQGGKNRQLSAQDGSAVAGDLDQAVAEADPATDRPQQEIVASEDLGEENAVQTDPAAREGQSGGGNADTNVSTNPTQRTQSEMESGKDDRSRRQEKKPTKNATTQNRVADAAPQQTTADDPTAVSVDLKTATSEPTTPVAGPQVDTADGSIKPVGTADGQSSGSMRLDANRPGRATAAARAPANAPGPEGADQARFVGRVARAFQAMGDRNGPMRLKLSPPELGSLRIEISVRGGIMTAQVEAETATARNLLLDNLPALRDRLAQQGIKIEQFNVDLSDRSPGGLPDQRPDHADSDGRGEKRPTTRADHEETDRGEDGRPAGPITRPGEGSQLNVIA